MAEVVLIRQGWTATFPLILSSLIHQQVITIFDPSHPLLTLVTTLLQVFHLQISMETLGYWMATVMALQELIWV